MTIVAGVDITEYKRHGSEIWFKKSEAKFWNQMCNATNEHNAIVILAALINKPEKQ